MIFFFGPPEKKLYSPVVTLLGHLIFCLISESLFIEIWAPKGLQKWSQKPQKVISEGLFFPHPIFYRFLWLFWWPETLKTSIFLKKNIGFSYFCLIPFGLHFASQKPPKWGPKASRNHQKCHPEKHRKTYVQKSLSLKWSPKVIMSCFWLRIVVCKWLTTFRKDS